MHQRNHQALGPAQKQPSSLLLSTHSPLSLRFLFSLSVALMLLLLHFLCLHQYRGKNGIIRELHRVGELMAHIVWAARYEPE